MEIDRTARLEVPDYMWPKVQTALRELRKLHQRDGGTSKVRKKGRRVTVTFSGDPFVVKKSIDFLFKLRDTLEKSRRDLADSFIRRSEEYQEQRKREFMEMIFDMSMRQDVKKPPN